MSSLGHFAVVSHESPGRRFRAKGSRVRREPRTPGRSKGVFAFSDLAPRVAHHLPWRVTTGTKVPCSRNRRGASERYSGEREVSGYYLEAATASRSFSASGSTESTVKKKSPRSRTRNSTTLLFGRNSGKRRTGRMGVCNEPAHRSSHRGPLPEGGTRRANSMVLLGRENRRARG